LNERISYSLSHVQNTQCSRASAGDWVDCDMQTWLDFDPAAATHIRIFFWGNFGTDTANLDFDDIHFDQQNATNIEKKLLIDDIMQVGSGSITLSPGTRLVSSDPYPSATTVHDGTTKDLFIVRGLKGEEPGVVFDPMKFSCIVVDAMTFYTSTGSYERDPASYRLFGQKYEDSPNTWTPISSGFVALDTNRNGVGLQISDVLEHKKLVFSNTLPYARYKVTFPEAKKADGEIMIGEVKLSGFLCPSSYQSNVVPAITALPYTGPIANVAINKLAWQSGTMQGATANLAVDGNTNGVYSFKSVILTNALNGPMWKVDLAKEYTIEEIIIWNRSDCCQNRLSNYAIELLDDNNNPVYVFRNKDTVDLSKQDSHYKVPSIAARYVALHNWSGNVLHIAELQVMARVASEFDAK